MKLNGLISALLLLSLLLNACGGESKKEEAENKEVEQKEVADETKDVQKSLINALEKMSEGTTKHKKAETCEEYLANFEKWADKYIAVLEKVAKNSTDMTAIMEMGTLAPELAQWTMEWDNMAKCSEDPEFVKEHEEIVKRIEAAADKIEKK